MTISSATEAVAARDQAQHLFHSIETRLADLKSLLVDLDAWVTAQLADSTGVVKPMDGTNKPPA